MVENDCTNTIEWEAYEVYCALIETENYVGLLVDAEAFLVTPH